MCGSLFSQVFWHQMTVVMLAFLLIFPGCDSGDVVKVVVKVKPQYPWSAFVQTFLQSSADC